jgi:hypothetical protein
MKTISFLTFLAGIVATYAAPAPAAGTSDINGKAVFQYPDGVPLKQIHQLHSTHWHPILRSVLMWASFFALMSTSPVLAQR